MDTPAYQEMRLDRRYKHFPDGLTAQFTLDQKRNVALGKTITLPASQLKCTSKRKDVARHTIFITHAQSRAAQDAIRENKSFKLKFSPDQRDFVARFGTGFFGDLWDGVKSAAKTVYNGAKKVVGSKIGQAVLNGAALALQAEGIPAGVTVGLTNGLLGINPNAPEEEEEEAVPEEDLPPQIQQYAQEYRATAAPKTYNFPAPPVPPRPSKAAVPPPIPPRPYPAGYNPGPPPPPPAPPLVSHKAPKKGGMVMLPRKGKIGVLGSRPFTPQIVGSGSGWFGTNSVYDMFGPKTDFNQLTKLAQAKKGSGVVQVGSGVPRVINTSRGVRYHDGRKFITKDKYASLVKKGGGVLLPGVTSY